VARVAVVDRSQAAEARRAASALAQNAGLSSAAAGRIELIATEAGNNLAAHTKGGEILVSTRGTGPSACIELLAIDKGPGMNIEKCLADGYSTAGTRGAGLGAIKRAATDFDVYSRESGTILFAAVCQEQPAVASTSVIGSARAAKHGEKECGDAWTFVQDRTALRIMLADGLGHGEFAAEAAEKAASIFESRRFDSAVEAVQELHKGLRGTRGAAIAVAYVSTVTKSVEYCGLGNISSSIWSDGKGQHMVSMNGTAGHEAYKIAPFRYSWTSAGYLLMHSDGLLSQCALDKHPGILRHHPSVIAGLLYRDYNRGRDDAMVVVARLV
ncbi:MAG TPA: ATP-binding protein, partial [Bryobacteraceae bacterium]|nr:ATP-binding protein [Bryobacteraceae bacterium]